MAKVSPRICVGLPVYNGQAFVRSAIESVLSQTFGDFTLVICDNASTDSSEAICREYAERDSRVKYFRNPVNLGAGPNFSLAFSHAGDAEYFKWMASDDQLAPTYLQRCVAALDADSGAVLAHAKARIIDGQGTPVRFEADGSATVGGERFKFRDIADPPRDLGSLDVAKRVHEVLIPTKWCFEIFALIRTQVMRQFPVNLNYYGGDKVLLLAMALRGRFAQVDEELFFRRFHAGQSSNKSNAEQAVWIDARARGIQRLIPAQLKCLAAHAYHVTKVANLEPVDRMRCYGEIGKFCGWLASLIWSQRYDRGILNRLWFAKHGKPKVAEADNAHEQEMEVSGA